MVERGLIALAVGLIAGGTSAFVMPWLIGLAERYDILSYPTEPRQVHRRPLPRIGGPGIFLGFVAGLALSFVLPVERFPIEIERIALLVIGSGLVVASVLYDDLIGLRPIPKLLWQTAAAAIMILPRLRGPEHGLVIEQFRNPFGGMTTLPLVIAVLFTFFWVVGMMNTVNFLDGLDGLAGTVVTIACVVLFLHTFFRPAGNPQFTISLLPMALGAATFGFLVFNWHPARILMGDSGAMFLGYALAVTAMIGGAKIATALLVLWLPILDVAWLILYRLRLGRSPMAADRSHLHHRLLDRGWSQRQIVGLFAAVSSAFGAAALLLPGPLIKLLVLSAAGILGLVALALLARQTPKPAATTEQSVSQQALPQPPRRS
jgi:UDP-N-acetylmuramyl pentapeptide phosphotransferase/UDP-N-acetylglucosamine-1-phosphate transferase